MRIAPEQAAALEPARRTVLLCRDPREATAVQGVAGPMEVHGATVEAVLSVARARPEAVTVRLADLEGRARSALASLARVGGDVPLVLLAAPPEEGLARQLVNEDLADDYVVLPRGIGELSRRVRRLCGEDEPAEAESAAKVPAARTIGGVDAGRLFTATCDLVRLAGLESDAILERGAARILEAAGADHGCAFAVDERGGQLKVTAVVGEGPDELQRAAAERAVRTGETLVVTRRAGGPTAGALCVPLADGGRTFGALCLTGDPDALDVLGREAVGPLARALAQLLAARSR